MQIKALYDTKGRILAAVQVQVEGAETESSPSPQPVPTRGQRVSLLTMPAEFEHLTFRQACMQMMVKVKGKQAVLVFREKLRC